MRSPALPYTIVATDVEKSSRRDDDLLLRMRADLRAMLGQALADQGVEIDAVPVLDDGDGFRLLLPADIAPRAALDPFLGRLGVELRNHRRASSELNRLRLRVAVHHGLLTREQGGSFSGTPMQVCARLLDSQAGRDLLAGAPAADFVLLVTDHFFGMVVRGGATLAPEEFRRIRVEVKETDAPAWAYLPPGGAPAPPAAGPPPTARAAAEPPAGSSIGVWLSGDGHTIGDIYGGGHGG
ncbi:hypothetical protein [Actinoplanes sp. RD1]|uniref:hypothetical protein n=1 Tax=Actinoplanes sp. RD1 TaxID=3064538 RepID=UPI002741AA46|nr:hypothetical protein [Actinoplanes sp. RD1]